MSFLEEMCIRDRIAMIDEAIYKLQKFVVRRWLLVDHSDLLWVNFIEL